MNSHLHIICYRWGTRYGADYVNRLSRMVRRHLSPPYTFHCVTDDAEGLDADIRVDPLPPDHFAANWNKLRTFQPDFLGLEGETVVCLDVDLVIVSSIDFLRNDPAKKFLIARNWTKSSIRGNSSVYRLRVGGLPEVWSTFIADVPGNIEKFHGKNRSFGDQQWLNHAIPEYDYFADGKIVSFKRHCSAKSWQIKVPLLGALTGAAFGKARVPPGAAIVLFHGDPLPPDVMNHHHGQWKHATFVAKHWR